MKTKRKRLIEVAIVRTTIKLPEVLHDGMKTIQYARRVAEGSDVKLCRIYKEAVELYLNAEPQQRILKATA
jgi:hypothetical protein